MPDDQEPVRVGVASSQWDGGQFVEAIESRLVDSMGLKMLGEGEWKTKKQVAEYRRQWRKVHLAIDAETLEIRVIEVTLNCGYGVYDTKKVHSAAADRGAEVIIPVRKNGKPWKENTSGAQARNETLRAMQRLSRAIWKKWGGYHRRSLVETKMRCFKLLGERFSARIFNSQVAELQIRAAP